MARYANSPLTPDIKGKIGGMSISTSQSGKVMKVTSRPRLNSSLASNINKSIIYLLQNKWRNLTQNQRDGWDAYANFRPVEQRNNPGRFINGQQYYIKYNYAYYAQFGSTQDNVFFTSADPFYNELSLTILAGNIRLVSTVNIDETDNFVLFKVSAPMPPSRKQPTGGTKLMKVIFANSMSVSFTAPYLKAYGAIPTTGDTVFVEYTFFKTLFLQWSAPTAVKLIVS